MKKETDQSVTEQVAALMKLGIESATACPHALFISGYIFVSESLARGFDRSRRHLAEKTRLRIGKVTKNLSAFRVAFLDPLSPSQ